MLFLDPNNQGYLTNVKPQGPNHTVIMGYVVYAHQEQGKIFVKVDNGYEINELHNVLISGTPSNGQALLYNSGLNVWEAGTVSLTSGDGNTGAQGPAGPTGAGGSLGYYGVFIDTTTQTNDNSINAFRYNTTLENNGVSIQGTTQSKITFEYPGTYNMQFSAQIDKTDGGVDQIEIWFAKNGQTVEWSNTVLESDAANFEIVASWNYLATVNAGDW